jgi:hypothetical protein
MSALLVTRGLQTSSPPSCSEFALAGCKNTTTTERFLNPELRLESFHASGADTFFSLFLASAFDSRGTGETCAASGERLISLEPFPLI